MFILIHEFSLVFFIKKLWVWLLHAFCSWLARIYIVVVGRWWQYHKVTFCWPLSRICLSWPRSHQHPPVVVIPCSLLSCLFFFFFSIVLFSTGSDELSEMVVSTISWSTTKCMVFGDAIQSSIYYTLEENGDYWNA